jgi:hypothetical protein
MKKLLVFMFSVVLLGSCGKEGCADVYSVDYNADATKDDGSCSDQRRVKFSIEMGDDFTYVYPNSQPVSTEGWCWAQVHCEYISAGLNQVGGTDGIGQGNNSQGWNLLFSESEEYIFEKNDNITMELSGVVKLMENVSFVVKAQINNEEIILWNKTYNVTVAGQTINETQNWIVP